MQTSTESHLKREAVKCAESYLGRAVIGSDMHHVASNLKELRKLSPATSPVSVRVLANNLMRLLREYDVPERLHP